MKTAIPLVQSLVCLGAVWADADEDSGAEPALPVVRILAATFVETEQYSGISFSVELSNPHDESVTFLGYTPDSFGPPLEEGQIAPIYGIEFKRDGEWVRHPLGWCGTGMGAIELKPDSKPTFSAFAAGAEDWEAVRVGISTFDLTDMEEPPPVVWSEEFANEPMPPEE